MTKLFQLLTGSRASTFLKASGEPGMILTVAPEFSENIRTCQLVVDQCTHHIAMLEIGTDVRLPKGVCEIAYGDCNQESKCSINLSCDIMDYNFWYYHKLCSKRGCFYFSVNTDECDLEIYLSTIQYLKQNGLFQEFWGLIE
jgi:hypothetical protein